MRSLPSFQSLLFSSSGVRPRHRDHLERSFTGMKAHTSSARLIAHEIITQDQLLMDCNRICVSASRISCTWDWPFFYFSGLILTGAAETPEVCNVT